MGGNITRATKVEDVAITASSATTPKIDCLQFAGGGIYIPTGATIATITFWGAVNLAGTFYALYDKDGSAVTLTVAAERFTAFPTEIFNCGAFQMVGDAAESGAVIVLKG